MCPQTLTDQTVLAVDLDGTLVRTDTLWEALLQLLKQRPGMLVRIPLWIVRGRAYAKRRIAQAAPVDAAFLPYNDEVLAFLRAERDRGREIVLATASDAAAAQRVADHLGLFSAVLASDGARNLAGASKRDALSTFAGGRGFDYMGDASVDLPVWRAARTAITVVAPGARGKRLSTAAGATRQFTTPRPTLSTWVRTLRVHQWVKNLLLYVPLLAAHEWSGERFVQATLAFVAFSLCASGGYLINDLLDLASDRRHPDKQSRALASGTIALPRALAVAGTLFVIGFAGAALALPLLVIPALALYAGLTIWYSVYLKSVAIVDVLTLSSLYTLRILAGAVAVSVTASPWLLAFSVFLFLSLAFVKRYSELAMLRDRDLDRAHGRGYGTGDLELIRAVGPATGYMAVLVLTLYINSDKVLTLYEYPWALWLIGPLLLYWVTRIWFLANRGAVHSDPLVFALRDRVSYLVGGLVVLIVLLAA